MPGLARAEQRAPVTLNMELHRLNRERLNGERLDGERLDGERLDVEVAFPDEVAALTLKAFASQVRDKPTDIVDLWRCLEVAYAAGADPEAFSKGETAEAARVIRALFDSRVGEGMAALAVEQRLSAAATDQRFTRIRALMQRILP